MPMSMSPDTISAPVRAALDAAAELARSGVLADLNVTATRIGRSVAPVAAVAQGNNSYVVATPFAADGYIRNFNVHALTAGTVYLERWAHYDGDKWVRAGRTAVVVAAGANAIDLVAAGVGLVPFRKGEYPGLYGHTGAASIIGATTMAAEDGGYYGVGGSGNVSTFTDSTVNTTFQIEYQLDLVLLSEDRPAMGPCAGAGVVAYYDGADLSLTRSGGAVVSWPAQGGGRALVPYSTTKAPKLSLRRGVSFADGNQALQFGLGDYPWTFHSMKVLPAPSVVGANDGWPCTGISRFSDGRWVIAHDGRTSDVDTSYETRLVIYSPDFGAKLAEIDLVALVPTIQSIQGLWVDGADTVWVADSFNQAVRHVSAAGALLGSITGLGFNVNGLAGDAEEGVLYLGVDVGSAVVSVVAAAHAAGPAVIRTLTLGAEPDHLHFSGGLLFSTHGANGSNGYILATDPDTGAGVGRYYSLTKWQAAEGLYIDGTRAYVTNDGGFHTSATPPYSMVLAFDLGAVPSRVRSTKLMLSGVISRPTLQSGSSNLALAVSGDPITGTPVGGWALLLNPSTDTLRWYAKAPGTTTAAAYAVDFPLGALGTDVSFALVVDVATGATLYVNGAAVAPSATSGVPAAMGANLSAPSLMLGAFKPYNLVPLARFANPTVYGFGLFTSDADRAKVEGWQAWRFGLVASLPGGHAYKAAPPVF